ncbi:MAG: hypothetical protein A3C55_01865 [Gammaproteobacteria bacterium RIFCSPHIGHO2_02_FULL_42_13]|nr:MAG: hypothetical protein A3C55_01865 [Gammaproteobacteria bacterium RIFCSPHIGHO2_02_FULL_42_13]OGT70038.1 MAG: hypothetical protein A3H43_05730 [Gammaproteobacteria bacterium RIFCSPLOWO2_02_FULL_42_9]
MKKWFKKENSCYGDNQTAETPYQRAKDEWDERMGVARVQAKNWRFIALLSTVVALLSLVMLAVSLSMSQNVVYVAQVTTAGRVVNVSPLQVPYQPAEAQEEYFVTQFVKLVREIPMDPVVAKKNWMDAYNFLTERSSKQLNDYFQKNNPVDSLGKQTISVEITDINPISAETYQVDWIETSVDSDGKASAPANFSGTFSLMVQQPTSQKTILLNPLGIYITNFHISVRELA